jgi:hypothetical protein
VLASTQVITAVDALLKNNFSKNALLSNAVIYVAQFKVN